MDKYFRVEVVTQTPNPQQAIYAALHQDYAESFVWDDRDLFPSEEDCGELIIKHLLAGNRGHYGPLEHPQIVFNIGWFPHSTLQQIRTHRVGVSFDCQSLRYTGKRISDAAYCDRKVEEVFYLRPVGEYTDRTGKKYKYTEEQRNEDREDCLNAAIKYAYRVNELGFSEEHARDLIPYAIRQHWVMSANVRSLMHLLLIRGKRDAQLEAQQMCELILPHFQAWCPQVYEWFMQNQWLKGRLAP